MRHVERPIVLVANSPLKWTVYSEIDNLDCPCAELMTPHASSISTVIEQGRLYFAAIAWKSATSCSSLPSPRRYLGVSFNLITVIRAILIRKTMAPLVYITYRQPMLPSFRQAEVLIPLSSNGFGQFHLDGAVVNQHKTEVKTRQTYAGIPMQ